MFDVLLSGQEQKKNGGDADIGILPRLARGYCSSMAICEKENGAEGLKNDKFLWKSQIIGTFMYCS
ncbi:hypothetical protein P0082_10690 [Candidatus Haliotispira prima]|uniref:Uncharacterized protein n=1 Tax=Candidatus Haliotispira prima TaxID=3034016 RepID=A0ABY8MG08_9SPIO|nr:hypothetical protein P0082_10690 [Candidatus Haliotispira prima]